MASSFHLGWLTPITRWDTHEVIWRCVEAPPSTTGLIFWASQMTFYQTDGIARGGSHFGPQVSGTTKGINWGGYDDIAGAGVENRGSIPSDGNNGQSYDWQPGRDYYFRVFKSPKQNYLAAELTVRPGQITGNQQAGEIAWRLEVTDLSTGTTTFIRDLLIRNCATANAMGSGSMWSEDFNTATPPTATVPWEIQWTEPRVNEQLVTSASTTYNTGADSLSNTNSHINAPAIGWRQKSVTTRTNAAGVTLIGRGVFARSWTSISLGDTFSANLVLNEPAGAANGDRLLAILAVDGPNSIATPTGWELVLAGTVGAGGEARLWAFAGRRGTGASSYSFTASASGLGAGVLYALVGADLIAVAKSVVAKTTGTAWSAPELTKDSRYGRMIWAAACRPAGAGVATTIGAAGSPIKKVDTVGITADWIVLASGYESLPDIGSSALAKGGGASNGGWSGAQIEVHPILQRSSPTSDVSVGAWTPTPLWSKIDETLPDPTDLIEAPAGSVATVALGTLEDPLIGIGHVVRYRCRRQNADTASLTVDLLEGATVRATKVETIPAGDAWLSGALTLTTAQADAIVDYSALRLRLTAG